MFKFNNKRLQISQEEIIRHYQNNYPESIKLFNFLKHLLYNVKLL